MLQFKKIGLEDKEFLSAKLQKLNCCFSITVMWCSLSIVIR